MRRPSADVKYETIARFPDYAEAQARFGLLSIILWSVVIGAVWGAIFGFVAHWATGDKRDFKSLKTMAADTYLVQVQASRANEAMSVLGR